MDKVVFHLLPVDSPEMWLVSQASTKRGDVNNFAVCIKHWSTFKRKWAFPLQIHRVRMEIVCVDQIWYSLDGGPISLGISVSSVSYSMEEDPLPYRSLGSIFHSSGLVKCYKSLSIKAFCLATMHWKVALGLPHTMTRLYYFLPSFCDFVFPQSAFLVQVINCFRASSYYDC